MYPIVKAGEHQKFELVKLYACQEHFCTQQCVVLATCCVRVRACFAFTLQELERLPAAAAATPGSGMHESLLKERRSDLTSRINRLQHCLQLLQQQQQQDRKQTNPM